MFNVHNEEMKCQHYNWKAHKVISFTGKGSQHVFVF